MAMDMFIDCTNGIEGETADAEFKKKKGIDVLAWSWGVSNSGSAQVGGGAGAGKANFQDLSFTKWQDKSTAKLTGFCSLGTHIDKITLSMRKAGDGQKVFYTLVLEDCIITSISKGGSGGEDRLTENVTINFAMFTETYQIQDSKGNLTPGSDFSYDIAENAKQ